MKNALFEAKRDEIVTLFTTKTPETISYLAARLC